MLCTLSTPICSYLFYYILLWSVFHPAILFVSMFDCVINPLVSISLTIVKSHWERAFNLTITGTMILIPLECEEIKLISVSSFEKNEQQLTALFVIQLQWCSSALYSLSLHHIVTVGAVGHRCDMLMLGVVRGATDKCEPERTIKHCLYFRIIVVLLL